MKIIILHPSGQREERELPIEFDNHLEALQAAVGVDIEYLSPAFYGLHNSEVVTGIGYVERREAEVRAVVLAVLLPQRVHHQVMAIRI
ncbi:hypothetical protein GCM10022631_01490 [Deinococcus rubellus]|uniref:hypothetical protein n=1 Tax=Deinococcus rubellus TaxID=1889240 RepID=UPI0031E9F126